MKLPHSSSTLVTSSVRVRQVLRVSTENTEKMKMTQTNPMMMQLRPGTDMRDNTDNDEGVGDTAPDMCQ